MKKGIRAYNLYPKLVGSMNMWIKHFERIQAMNFDWIYINPINYPGFSGSDYSIKNYYHYHPLYVTGEMDFENPEAHVEKGNKLLKNVCKEADQRGMKIMMDLVINHSAFDSHLIEDHPEWYERDPDGQLKHPGAQDGDSWVEWKDLAQINNAHSSDRDNLWHYWLTMMLFYLDLGIRGFRCDAAYHVPNELWHFLIPRIKEKYPDAIFLGETLGCSSQQAVDIAEAGFDFITNSFKWWDLKEQWFLDQTQEYSRYASSISFPENHDTIRSADEFSGNQHQALLRYELGAYICSSISTTIGFEYGFQRQIDVVQINPSWWEPICYDISDDIAKINDIKASYDVLQEDNGIEMLQLNDGRILGFTKESRNGQEKIMMLANPDGHNAYMVRESNVYGIMGSDKVQDISRSRRMKDVPAFLEYNLLPGEVKLLYVKR
ncbi:alpha-amylase [Psychromonas sp. MB-3u-54]|uniref:alpha-amylase family glycosyl hydrolase n=1 Tax=Psychromonas sp. MB-3u-54 TaxID=2058319 RepID=UPI000C321B99|nr:alpha-amylase family glycosyl hydrolase [Psychromonas sp. MB-3u-54]PKH01312.1 alpha-amylase [Psychromonas sp. MB-3u-54]